MINPVSGVSGASFVSQLLVEEFAAVSEVGAGEAVKSGAASEEVEEESASVSAQGPGGGWRADRRRGLRV